tara:strand:+ start:243 stop:371 length:129 start_codon:yes stop_codon:yes gene_type:complete
MKKILIFVLFYSLSISQEINKKNISAGFFDDRAGFNLLSNPL